MSGTQSRAHSAVRVKTTFTNENGAQFKPKSLMDLSWNPNHSVSAMHGDGQVAPIAHVMGHADPSVSMTLEHADLAALIATFGVGARLGCNFTSPAIGTVAAFDVEILGVVFVPGEHSVGTEGIRNSLEFKCQDIKHDGVSIVEPADTAAV